MQPLYNSSCEGNQCFSQDAFLTAFYNPHASSDDNYRHSGQMCTVSVAVFPIQYQSYKDQTDHKKLRQSLFAL